MSVIVAEVYEAFLSADTPKEKAKKAAEALANYDNRFTRIELDSVLLKWMCGTILAGIVALVLKAFFHSM
jgi:hypothetical protein